MTDFTPPPPNLNMSSPLGGQRTLVDRVKSILMTPQTEWAVIDAEASTIGEIFRGYVVPLAAIGPVATLIGSLVFGHSLFGITYRPGIVGAIVTALISYALALGMTYVVALVIEALAPQFGAIKDRTRAYKVAAYGATASWVAGIFGIFPAIGFLSILGLFSLYLIWLGIPAVMKAPADKATPYTAVSILVMVVASLIVGAVTVPVAAMFAGPATTAGGTISGALAIPGGGSVDLGKLEAAGKQLEARSAAVQNGTAKPPIPGPTLQALLPAALPGGLARTSVENSSANAGGIGGSQAEARYGSGDSEITLTVTDMGAMGAIAAMGGALGIESSKQTATGYERVGKVDGRLTTEEFQNDTHHGKYSTIVADRFNVEAAGNAPSIDALKGAVATVDLGRLGALATQ